jgi:hypothetical protein
MQTPPSTSPRSKQTMPLDKADRLTRLLNSALKEEKLKKSSSLTPSNSPTAEAQRCKELESKLTLAKKEIKKHKEECQELKHHMLSYVEEVSQVKSVSIVLCCILLPIHSTLHPLHFLHHSTVCITPLSALLHCSFLCVFL